MKKILTLTLVMLTSFTLQAQKYGGPAPVNTKTAEYSRESSLSKVELSVEYPIDGFQAYINGYNSTVLQDLADPIALMYSSEADTPAPSLAGQTTEEALKTIATHFGEQAKATAQEFYENSEDEDVHFPQYSLTATVKKVYNNHLYVTFTTEGNVYTGGAHGMPCKIYYTLDRTTGKRYLRSDLFPESVSAKLANIVRRNMLSSGEYTKDNFDDPNFGLPKNEYIGLSKEGITFIYEPYEIACYALGMPETTVPWQQVYSILTEKGKSLSAYNPNNPSASKYVY